ncbi:hypothetical protein HMN09_00612800 [Mycena chlorophos]|uniref:Uncharacterized protein n=1 Tax=Mycena chlorophos TaxID=658473 RepID=A0A8H6T4G8_MYCCL|nr:hypothetical protein HMN09_00612800 [Mycena chlorophos]
MQFDAPALKPWLVRTLEPICDAEPGALADYILALLKHNVPESEMRNELALQLQEFLENECRPFIDTLFTAIRTKSYLPYSSAEDGPISTLPSSPRTRKRSLDSDDRDGRPTKGPRLSNEGWGGRSNGYRDRDQPPHMSNGVRRNAPSYMPPEQKRGICRDYYNNGYCSRGAYCKFSHGEDAVVPEQLFAVNSGGPMPAMPFMPMFQNGFGPAGPTYDPHEARMDMRPTNNGRMMPRAPLLPRSQQEEAMLRPGELPVIQDLTPPNLDANNNQQQHNQPAPPPIPLPQQNYGGYGGPMDVEPPQYPQPNPPPSFRGRGGGPRAKGVFNGEVHKFNGERRGDKTLVVEKIPHDKLTLEAVNDWFKRFGTVTNVAIDASGAKALVSFSNHDEARAAWKSEDAVFSNRFVKVFWHRPMEGQGQNGARMLAASAPLMANMTAKSDAPPVAAAPVPAPAPRPTATPRKVPTAASTALAVKQQLLEKQIAEQKALMASLTTAPPDERKEIMAKLRKLGDEMTGSKTEDAASKERERLDKELELHNAVSSAEGEETTEDLKAKLQRLKEEAASLGISDSGADPSWGTPFRGGHRGRGRGGRSFYRGAGFARGGPPRGSMKLDNRPKKLLIKGADPDSLQAVRDWYETTGQVESVTAADDGDILVSFYSRAAAEQGLGKGQNISLVGQVQVSWYTGATSGSTSIDSSIPAVSVDVPLSPSHEEEVVGGWGDGEDDDGMGMP